MTTTKGRAGKAAKPKILSHRNGRVTAPIEHIKVKNNFNVRKDTKPDAELQASVAEHGVLNPIHVMWKDNKEDTLYIVDGERRYRAAKAAKWTEVPVVCRGHLDLSEALIISLSTNESQRSLTRAERAEGYKRLRDAGHTVPEIAGAMGCSERMVNETLRLVDKAVGPIRKAAMSNGEGIPTRAASRAALLPEKVQKKLAPKMKGKTTVEALEMVRAEEKKLGKVPKQTRKTKTSKATGKKTPKQTSATKSKSLADRLNRAESALLKEWHKNQNDPVLTGQVHLCEALKGHRTISSLFKKTTIKKTKLKKRSA